MVPWPSVDIHIKFYRDRPRGTPPVEEGLIRKQNVTILDLSKAISWKWFGTRCNLNKIHREHLPLSMGSSIVPCSAVVRDFGVLLDSELSMKHHISKVTSTCYYHLRRLHQIRNYVSREIMITNRKSYISFRLIPKSLTLNDLERRKSPYFALFHRIR